MGARGSELTLYVVVLALAFTAPLWYTGESLYWWAPEDADAILWDEAMIKPGSPEWEARIAQDGATGVRCTSLGSDPTASGSASGGCCRASGSGSGSGSGSNRAQCGSGWGGSSWNLTSEGSAGSEGSDGSGGSGSQGSTGGPLSQGSSGSGGGSSGSSGSSGGGSGGGTGGGGGSGGGTGGGGGGSGGGGGGGGSGAAVINPSPAPWLTLALTAQGYVLLAGRPRSR